MDAKEAPHGRWKRHRRGWWKRKRFWILLMLLIASVVLSYWLIDLIGVPAKPD